MRRKNVANFAREDRFNRFPHDSFWPTGSHAHRLTPISTTMSATAPVVLDFASLDNLFLTEELTAKQRFEQMFDFSAEDTEPSSSSDVEAVFSGTPPSASVTGASHHRQETPSLSPRSTIYTPSSSTSAVRLPHRYGKYNTADESNQSSYPASVGSFISSSDGYVYVPSPSDDCPSGIRHAIGPASLSGESSSQQQSRASSLVPNASLIQINSNNNSFPWMQSHNQDSQAGDESVTGYGAPFDDFPMDDYQDRDIVSGSGFFDGGTSTSLFGNSASYSGEVYGNNMPLPLPMNINGPAVSGYPFNGSMAMDMIPNFPSELPHYTNSYGYGHNNTFPGIGGRMIYSPQPQVQPAPQPPSLPVAPAPPSPTKQEQHARRIQEQRERQEARVRDQNPEAEPDEENVQPAKRSPKPIQPFLKKEPPQTPPSSPLTKRKSKADGKPKNKGGRPLRSSLIPTKKEEVLLMRKKTACWRCALQRDPCSRGDPCERCMKAQKGQTYFFGCDRSKLPDFVFDFLPPQASMTLMHQKQSIEDCVSEQVSGWDRTRPVDIYLTSGYGQALRWTVYEFQLRTDELLNQYQYLQKVESRRSVRHEKWSPPLGLLKLQTSDEAHFQNYLDQLMSDEYLQDFAWVCFEEESQIDDFQPRLLDLMCDLYMTKKLDYDLQLLLKDILRMTIITYIMGHTLTLLEETHPSILTHLHHSRKPTHLPRHTSPRLANRQLKFFFSVLRNNIYTKILKWAQQTLKNSHERSSTWLPSFCMMLGFGMVLEEVQRTLLIQADAKAEKREKSEVEAVAEARNACERIDERWGLLVGLFQCKYRDKKWTGQGAFGNQTPPLTNPAERKFCQGVRALVEEKYQHLQSRKDVAFALENQCDYTSRLVARFLLPFLNLPPGAS